MKATAIAVVFLSLFFIVLAEFKVENEEDYVALRQLAADAAEYDRTYYQILGVREDATTKVIKQRFFLLAKELHPDLNPTSEAEETYRAVAKAHKVLSDQALREKYDYLLTPEGSEFFDAEYEGEAGVFGQKYKKRINTVTESTWSVVVAVVVVFSTLQYGYLHYAFHMKLEAAKKTPQYLQAMNQAKQELKNKKKKHKKSELKHIQPPAIEFVDMKRPSVLQLFVPQLLWLPVRMCIAAYRFFYPLDEEEEKKKIVGAIKLSSYGYKEDYDLVDE